MNDFFTQCAEAKRTSGGKPLAAVHILTTPFEQSARSAPDVNKRLLTSIKDKLRDHPSLLLYRQIDESSFDILVTFENLVALKNTLASLQETLHINGLIIQPQLRIGVCLYESSFSSAQAFYNARGCCYALSKQEENSVKIFDSEAHRLEENRQERQQEVLQAISDERIILFLQPKIDLKTSQIIGLECLARWQLEDGTIKPPDKFIPAVKGTDIELLLGFLVVKQAVIILQRFKSLGIKIPININVSPRQLSDRNFAQLLASNLKVHGIEPHMLGIEVLENEAFLQLEHTKRIFEIYKSATIDISLDDFGTGYASLNHLIELPIREVKIDRVFVKKIFDEPIYQAIIRGVVELAQELNLVVTVEGIETEQQHELVRSLGVDYAQGFLYQRPMSIDAFLAKFKNGNDGVYFVSW